MTIKQLRSAIKFLKRNELKPFKIKEKKYFLLTKDGVYGQNGKMG